MSDHWNQFELTQRPTKKRRAGEVVFSSLPESESMQEDMPPDILQTESPAPPPSKTRMVAETTFFNQRNQDFWHRTDLCHLRPYDFPYVRGTTSAAAVRYSFAGRDQTQGTCARVDTGRAPSIRRGVPPRATRQRKTVHYGRSMPRPAPASRQ